MTDQNEDIVERINRACPIDKVMAQDGFTLRAGHDKRRKCVEHDSLVVDVGESFYWWNSTGEHGDTINWVMKRRGVDFKGAVELLCRQYNLPEPNWGHESNASRVAARAKEEALAVAARVFHRWLMKDNAALAYAHGRGWTDETIIACQLGFSGNGTEHERKEITDEMVISGVDVRSPAAVSVLGYKGKIATWLSDQGLEPNKGWIDKGYITGMLGGGRLVYPHLKSGRVVYLAGRGITEKIHYNLHRELAGEKQLYFNQAYRFDSDRVILVEGQADAVSLGQMGYPAVALGNVLVKAGSDALNFCKSHKAVYIALDEDKAGYTAAIKIADMVGPMARLLRWDAITRYQGYVGVDGQTMPVKDANDLLKAFTQASVDADQQTALIHAAMQASPTYVEERCINAGKAQGAEKDEATKAALLVIARMDDLNKSQYRAKLAKALGVGVRDYDHMLKTATTKAAEKDLGEPIYTFGRYDPNTGWLLEYLYDPESEEPQLAWRDADGKIGSGFSVVIDGQKYLPFPVNETVRSGAVLFPSKVGEEKEIRELVTIVELFIKRVYLLPSEKVARMMAYYVLLTWVYDSFNTIMYLRAMGDAGSGKSEMMRRIGLMCYRTMNANGAGSTSSLFRAVERYRGTVFIDEADLNNSDTEADMVKFLNLGAMKNNPIWRTVEVTGPNGNKDFEEKAFQTFCPKLISMRKDFRDDAVGSRCLSFKLQPREQIELKRAGITNEINSSMRAQALAIRNLLLQWRLRTWQPEIEIDPEFYEMAISARLNQVAGPLLALAKEDPEQQEEIRRNLREYYQETILERSMTIVARIIEAFWKIWKFPDLHKTMTKVDANGDTWIKVGDLTRIANELINEMNGVKEEEEDDGGKKRKKKDFELTPQGTGHKLRNDMQLQMSKRQRDGYWVRFDEARLEGLSMRYGINPAELGPQNSKTPAQETML
jgi:DNA primase